MKVIALLAVKNEEWILSAYLSSVRGAVDEIVAVDDGSTDRSRALIQAANGLVVPARPGGDWETHWGAIREDLLRIGRERGGTHFVCLDADEALTTPAVENLPRALRQLEPGEKITMQWLALWKNPRRYRDDGSVWSNSFKDFVFADAPGYSFVGRWPHSIARTPGPNVDSKLKRLPPEQGAVLHYQFVPWTRFQVKQAWYRCAELIRAPDTAREINEMYSHGLDEAGAGTRQVPDRWLEGIVVPGGLEDLPPTWHLDELLEWFDERGIEFFEPLQIWHIPPLRDRFVGEVGREPRPLVGPGLTRRALGAIKARWTAVRNRGA